MVLVDPSSSILDGQGILSKRLLHAEVPEKNKAVHPSSQQAKSTYLGARFALRAPRTNIPLLACFPSIFQRIDQTVRYVLPRQTEEGSVVSSANTANYATITTDSLGQGQVSRVVDGLE